MGVGEKIIKNKKLLSLGLCRHRDLHNRQISENALQELPFESNTETNNQMESSISLSSCNFRPIPWE
jgi:hypothetical protein